MTSAWLLPEHIADVLPFEARRIEELRRSLLDTARAHGYELVIPPLVEHLDALLTGAGSGLDLQTFKLVDQLSGLSLGLRADTTPQVARIDAHLLNRRGLTRLCYCGPVLHTRPATPGGGREPLQFGAELYGHAGLEAEIEVHDLALDGLQRLGLDGLMLDLGDARLLRGVLEGGGLDAAGEAAVGAALAGKDAAALAQAAARLDAPRRQAVERLLHAYGGVEVLDEAAAWLPAQPAVRAALADLRRLVGHLVRTHPGVTVGLDLADAGGQGYYTGPRFTLYARGLKEPLLRGGRYDRVGAAFGRNRPAVGFSADLKRLAVLAPRLAPHAAIQAPWGEDPALRAAIRALRERGETVVCVLPGHEDETEEFACDRALVSVGGQWTVQPR